MQNLAKVHPSCIKLPKTKGARLNKTTKSQKRTNLVRIAWWTFVAARRFLGRIQKLSSNIMYRMANLHCR